MRKSHEMRERALKGTIKCKSMDSKKNPLRLIVAN